MTESASTAEDEIQLRAVQDFLPMMMKSSEAMQLKLILKFQGGCDREQLNIMIIPKREARYIPEISESRKTEDIEHVEPTVLYCRTGNIELQLETLENKGKSVTDEEPLVSRKANDESIEKGEASKISPAQENLVNDEMKAQLNSTNNDLDDAIGKLENQTSVDLNQEEEDQRGVSSDSGESLYSDDEVNPQAQAIPFTKGDKLKTIPPAIIGESIAWWRARNLRSGQIGFIPRCRVVVEYYQQSSQTTLKDISFEVLDIILEKSALQLKLNSSPQQKDEDVFKHLATVDFCWFQRINKPRLKKRIGQRLADFYRKTRRRFTIIRNNENYLLENIQPTDELIASLVSAECITKAHSLLILRRIPKLHKNETLLKFLKKNKPFDQTRTLSFVRCLRRNNQRTVAKIVENGGVVITVSVQSRSEKCTALTELLHRNIKGFRNRDTPWSQETGRLISQLKKDGIELLDSELDFKTLVIYIWCHSQNALENIKTMYESNQLKTVLFDFARIRTPTSESMRLNVINIDKNIFKKTVEAFPMSVNIIKRIHVGRKKYVTGVTKLRNEIYVLCSSLSSYSPRVIRIFEDQNSFRFNKKIKLTELKDPRDIVSNENENCLYVPDGNCIYKITREMDDHTKITKWLNTDYVSTMQSVSSDGHLLILSERPIVIVYIYGQDAELIRTTELPRDIKHIYFCRILETFTGNLIILHKWIDNTEGDSNLNSRALRRKWVVTELSGDGKMVIRRFIPSNETQMLDNPMFLAFNSDDEIFVSDENNDRVILLDSDLQWKRIVCPTDDIEETSMPRPWRLFYDEGKSQLFVGAFDLGKGLSVYALNRS